MWLNEGVTLPHCQSNFSVPLTGKPLLPFEVKVLCLVTIQKESWAMYI